MLIILSMARSDPNQEADKLKFRDLILPIQPRLFEILFDLSGVKTAGEFAAMAKPGDKELDQKLLGKYRKGTMLALYNLPGIAFPCETCGTSFALLSGGMPARGV